MAEHTKARVPPLQCVGKRDWLSARGVGRVDHQPHPIDARPRTAATLQVVAHVVLTTGLSLDLALHMRSEAVPCRRVAPSVC